ncbi:MAG: DUF1549 domain-containing protein [Myxococcota bacterium]|nr:DUF1549 domain-containing protein [Myxococcota bacterium]
MTFYLSPIWLSLTGCEEAPGVATEEPSADTAAAPAEPLADTGPQLEGVAWLARASLDLRGTRPSLDEIAAVQADPDAMASLIDEMLEDPRFPERMAWLWNDTLHTAVWGAGYTRFEWDFQTWKAIGWEPLAVIQLVLEDRRPFSDIVTATQTPVQADLSAAWDLPESGTAWSWGSYDDGRPMAGILSTNALWLRYTADAVNFNRTRANTVATTLLCSDFLDREGGFDFDINPADLALVESAVSTQPACLSCHATLDPLSLFFSGFAQKSDNHPQYQYVHYSEHQNLELLAESSGAPSYYGHPGSDLSDLGAMIAADPRFYQCATERFITGLTRQDPDAESLDSLSRAFSESGNTRALVRSIVNSQAYRAAGLRVLPPEQLYTALSDLGAWDPGTQQDEGLKALAWDPELRVLGGGTDDVTVLQRNQRPGVGNSVMMAWAARQMAYDAINTDLSRSEPLLLTIAELNSTDEPTVRAQLAEWHTRFLSMPVEADSPEIDALYDLWVAFDEETDLHPWPQTLAALIRHPRMVMY